jgi:hypothetical protein
MLEMLLRCKSHVLIVVLFVLWFGTEVVNNVNTLHGLDTLGIVSPMQMLAFHFAVGG